MRPILGATLAVALLALPAAAQERPLAGDPVNGAKLYKKAGKAKPKVDGSWLARYSEKSALKKLKSGKSGFPKISDDNELNRWDVLAYLQQNNTDVRELVPDSSHMLLSKGELDQYATERLTDQAKIKIPSGLEKGRVFVLFDLGDKGPDVRRVSEKNARVRDELKPDKKTGYVVFLPLTGYKGGKHEIGFGISKDIQVLNVVIRAPDGSTPDDLNQAARRFVGKGERGKYDKLKAPGAGRAMKNIAKPLSDAFLLAAERIYMYEVAENDHFQFDE
jgi:hypothetical protein